MASPRLEYSSKRGASPGRGARARRAAGAERGFGAAFFLILIAAASLSLVTLLERSGLAVQRAGFEAEREQARYLALAGAEHAVWRLQHEACFLTRNQAALGTDSLGAGQYSYRVTGSDTRVRIEASGFAGSARYALERSIDRLPSPARAMLVYGPTEERESQAREYAAGAWGDAAPTAALAREMQWCVLRGAPGRRERLLASLDGDDVLQLQAWSGDASWRSLGALAAGCDHETRCFDIAYESLSGKALIAYRSGADGDLHFRLWNGAVLGPEQVLDLPSTGLLRWVTLVPRRDTDDIAVLAIASDKQLMGAVWKGSGFADLRLLATDLDASDFEVGAVTFVDAGGAALFAWFAANALGQAIYRDGWLPASSLAFAGEARGLRLVARPGFPEANLAILTSNRHLTVLTWKSGAWDITTLKTITTRASTDAWRCFDLAYTKDDFGLIVYGAANTTLLQASVWLPMFGWVASQGGPDLGGSVRTVQLCTDPAANLVHICASTQLVSGEVELRLAAWKNKWTALSSGTSCVPSDSGEPFMLSAQGDVCLP